MTIASTAVKTSNYAGNGSVVEFAVTFPFMLASDLRVYLVTVATGAETLLTESTHYTVTGGNGTTGAVTTVSAYSDAYEIYVQRVTDRLQSLDLENQGAWYPERVEAALDKLTLITQEIDTAIVASDIAALESYIAAADAAVLVEAQAYTDSAIHGVTTLALDDGDELAVNSSVLIVSGTGGTVEVDLTDGGFSGLCIILGDSDTNPVTIKKENILNADADRVLAAGNFLGVILSEELEKFVELFSNTAIET